MTSSRPLPEGLSRRNFYGRRLGRPLRPRQQTLLATVLPDIEVKLPEPGTTGAPGELDLDKLFSPWPRTADRQVWLEIGFGDGGHLHFQARSNPHVAFIGCEPYVNGIAKLLAAIKGSSDEAVPVENLRVYSDDARFLLAALPSRSISRVFILFPDPWPKTRHHKRRIVSEQTLSQLARVLTENAEFRFATDHPEYCRWTLSRVLKHGAFEWLAQEPENWRQRPSDWPETRYESKARAAGRACYYLRFSRRAPKSAE